MNLLELFLGLMSSLGGFLDIGELVFTLQAGAKFGYDLLWVLVLGTVGIVLFGEMSGRIATVTHKPTFELVRERYGVHLGLAVLIASNLVNLLTCAAEVGGIAVVLQMLFGGQYGWMVAASAGLMLATIFSLKFKWIERLFGLMGLGLVAYVVAVVKLDPDWGAAARGLVPGPPTDASGGNLVYAYFAVGLFSAVLMPYEVYFYSSGSIEEKWKPKDLPMNTLNAVLGFTLGCLLAMTLVVAGALVYRREGLDSQLLSSTALPLLVALGVKGFLAGLLGMLFALGGAAAETALAGAYNACQFFGLDWSKDKKAREVPVFTATWIGIIVAGMAAAVSGVNPVKIVEYSVIFAVVVLPFSYYPILRTASDPRAMGVHVNRRWVTWAGWVYFGLIVAAAVAAIPLMVATHMGDG